MFTWAGDNHVHVEQVVSGSVDLDITQIGYDNTINFSFAHSGNDFNFSQVGNGNSISWVSYWGSGKAWGGDVDGSNNDEDVSQTGGATYGRHIWGNNNDVDVYQNGTHTHAIVSRSPCMQTMRQCRPTATNLTDTTRLRLLHFPKTGSGFALAVWSVACPGVRPPLNLLSYLAGSGAAGGDLTQSKAVSSDAAPWAPAGAPAAEPRAGVTIDSAAAARGGPRRRGLSPGADDGRGSLTRTSIARRRGLTLTARPRLMCFIVMLFP